MILIMIILIYYPHTYLDNLRHCQKKKKKKRRKIQVPNTGLEPMTSAMPVQWSSNWAMKLLIWK